MGWCCKNLNDEDRTLKDLAMGLANDTPLQLFAAVVLLLPRGLVDYREDG